MFEFFKRLAGAAYAYSTGKAYETSYKVAEDSTLQYIVKLWDAEETDACLDSKRFAACIWSYLLSTTPSNVEMLAFREARAAQIKDEALNLLEEDLPLQEVIVSTLYVALGVCRGYDDKERFERILEGPIFAKYSRAYPLLSPN